MITVYRKPGTASTGTVRLGIDIARYGFTPRGVTTVALAAGVASFVSAGATTISVTATDATGGSTPYTYQWRRKVDSGTFQNIANGGGVSGATTLSLTDGSVSSGHTYAYQIVYTDAVLASVTSNSVSTLTVYAGTSTRRPRLWRLM